jgi:hypothetical protein
MEPTRSRTPAGDRTAAAPPRSHFADLLATARPPTGLTVVDLVALTVGFAGAGTVARGAILAVHATGRVMPIALCWLAYLWLGLMMAGPAVEACRRLQHGRHRGTAGERLWILLGGAWWVVVLFRMALWVDPASASRLAFLSGMFAALTTPLGWVVLWYVERRHPPGDKPGWCHRAAVLGAGGWPLGWLAATVVSDAGFLTW